MKKVGRIVKFVLILCFFALIKGKLIKVKVPLKKIARKKIVRIQRLNIFSETEIDLELKKEFKTKRSDKIYDFKLFGLETKDYLKLGLKNVKNRHIKEVSEDPKDLEQRELNCEEIGKKSIFDEDLTLYWDGKQTFK